MKILEKTGVISEDNIKVMKPISHLIIVKNFNLESEKISVQLINSNTGGNATLINAISLKTLSEISAMDEGYYIDHVTESVSIITLGDDAIKLDADKHLNIYLEGMNAAKIYKIYGLESEDMDGSVWRYSKFQLAAGMSEKRFGVGKNEVLILPVTGLEKLRLFHKSGATPEYLPDELRVKQMMDNDVVKLKKNTVGDDLIFQAGNELVYNINVSDFIEFELVTDGNAYECIAIEEVPEGGKF